MQAHVLDGGVLLLPGSNSIRDYLRYNLRPLNLGHARLRLADGGTEKGASQTTWHQGFLSYARVVFDWLRASDLRPEIIVGHSLGAAAAQILCRSYGAPTVCFAAPRPKYVQGPIKHDDKLLILNRTDDIVPTLPPAFSHMARPRDLDPPRPNPFRAHGMPRYAEIIDTRSDLTGTWPA